METRRPRKRARGSVIYISPPRRSLTPLTRPQVVHTHTPASVHTYTHYTYTHTRSSEARARQHTHTRIHHTIARANTYTRTLPREKHDRRRSLLLPVAPPPHVSSSGAVVSTGTAALRTHARRFSSLSFTHTHVRARSAATAVAYCTHADTRRACTHAHLAHLRRDQAANMTPAAILYTHTYARARPHALVSTLGAPDTIAGHNSTVVRLALVVGAPE